MDGKTYGFAIVGTGMISRKHAEAIRQMGRARLVGVCDLDAGKAGSFAKEFNCESFTDLDIMLERSDIDVVSICTPSSLHGLQTIACARAGKHVVTEKPMDISWEQAQEMIECCRQKQVKLAVISQHRLHPDVVRIKSLIEQGAFGSLLIGNAAVNWYRTQDYYDSGSWRGTKKWDGGGALMNQGIHTVDLLQYLMGPVKSVFAHTRTIGHERIEVEDAAACALEFAGGGIGTLLATTCAYPGINTRIELFGEHGSAVFENNEIVFLKMKDESIQQQFAQAGRKAGMVDGDPRSSVGDTHVLQLVDLIDAIEKNREPFINGEAGAEPLRIILSAYESADIQQKITL